MHSTRATVDEIPLLSTFGEFLESDSFYIIKSYCLSTVALIGLFLTALTAWEIVTLEKVSDNFCGFSQNKKHPKTEPTRLVKMNKHFSR